jgi:hypothetical protein
LDTKIYHPDLVENFKLFSSLEQQQQYKIIEKNKNLFESIVELNSTISFDKFD